MIVEAISAGVAVIGILIPWFVFIHKAVNKHATAIEVIRVEMKHDREKLTETWNLLRKKLC